MNIESHEAMQISREEPSKEGNSNTEALYLTSNREAREAETQCSGEG